MNMLRLKAVKYLSQVTQLVAPTKRFKPRLYIPEYLSQTRKHKSFLNLCLIEFLRAFSAQRAFESRKLQPQFAFEHPKGHRGRNSNKWRSNPKEESKSSDTVYMERYTMLSHSVVSQSL